MLRTVSSMDDSESSQSVASAAGQRKRSHPVIYALAACAVLAAIGAKGAEKYQVRRFRAIPQQLVDIVYESDPDFRGFGALNLA